MKRSVTILYDRIEDDAFERALHEAADTTELVPVHVPLGEALAARGHSVKKLQVTGDIQKLLADLASDRSDAIFNICDGIAGDMKLAPNVVALLELLGKPFTGTGSVAMRLAGDKALTKEVFLANGIATPRFVVIPRGERSWRGALPFPLIVKPVDLDASEGITDRSIVHDARELLERVAIIHEQFQGAALVEEFIAGREIYATVFGNERPELLPLLEWPLSSDDAIGSWEAKWVETHVDYQRRASVFPTDLPPALVERIRRDAVVGFRALELADYARFDIRLAADGTPYVLEANPNPFFDVTAEVAVAAAAVGIEYGALAGRIVDFALARAGKRVSTPRRRRREAVKSGSGRRKRAG